MQVSNNRWFLAQDYEKNWWKSRENDVDFSFYQFYADELRNSIKVFLSIKPETKILEVGSGAGGIITYLIESNERYAIDPLEEFYSSVESFIKQRDSCVKYQTAMGEDIPFENNMFDLIIMDNVLDHCESPEKVLMEVKRVLNDKGIIYFKQNTYHIWGSFIRFIMEKFIIDKGHPHTFSKNKLKSMIQNMDLRMVQNSKTGYLKNWVREIKSENSKDKMKAFLFVTRDKVTYLVQKQS